MQTALATTQTTPPQSLTQASSLARLAVWALIEEAHLTPKPALVDRRGPGAHHDLTLALFERSAYALEPFFAAMSRAAALTVPGTPLRETLGSLGRRAEAAMFLATNGANTHRGAIYALGFLVAAATNSPACPRELCESAGQLAALPDRFATETPTHGRAALLAHGSAGARGEAAAGFPHVHAVGLPALRAARRKGAPEANARLDALLSIMSQLEDTCLLHRGGRRALDAAQQGAAAVLAVGGSATVEGAAALALLDRQLLTLWASPGGSADLFSATLFVDALYPEPHDA